MSSVRSVSVSIWASFVVESPTLKVFIGGDSGYGPHFKAIGEKHQDLDVAILENGQYDKNWSQIHTMPHELGKEAIELGAREVITVHHLQPPLGRTAAKRAAGRQGLSAESDRADHR